jgi:hypothetical protein
VDTNLLVGCNSREGSSARAALLLRLASDVSQGSGDGLQYSRGGTGSTCNLRAAISFTESMNLKRACCHVRFRLHTRTATLPVTLHLPGIHCT